MRRLPAVLVLAAFGTASVVAVADVARSSDGGPRLDRGRASFAVFCGFSHRNQDDPIVFPNQPNRSHEHTYFGNTSTNAFSTPASLRASARTTCRIRGDTAAYWAPTLVVGGRPVDPLGAVVYYVRQTSEPVAAFPAGLQVIAGSAAARSPQSQRVTSWSCGRRGAGRTSAVPTCPVGTRLRLSVNFPNCWDGTRLDSPDHQSHMAYSVDGVCPASHPVEVPALSLQIHYPVEGGPAAELSSGGQFSAHADFVNAWDQRTLQALVDRYLNRVGRRGR